MDKQGRGRRAARQVGFLCLSILSLFLWLRPGQARASNNILYVHGRNMKSWPSYALAYGGPEWRHYAFTYNGSDRFNDNDVRTPLRTALRLRCTGRENQCVILCYSSGCNRLLRALSELEGTEDEPDRILWIQATASAEGGSELANYTTKWLTKLFVKLTGNYADIDEDLRPSTMRGTFGYIQDAAPVTMWEQAGERDICKHYLMGLMKVCGNDRLPGEHGDGAVPFHSACGYDSAGNFSSCTSTASRLYPMRRPVRLDPFPFDHKAMLALGVVNTTERLGETKTIRVSNMPTTSGSNRRCDITKDDCDSAWDAREDSIADVLDITPPDTDRDGKPDLCVAVTRDGCAHCYEYSIAEASAQPGCLFRGKKTFANAGDVGGWEPVAADPPRPGTRTGLTSVPLPFGGQDIALAPGITAREECTKSSDADSGHWAYKGLYSERGTLGFQWIDASGVDGRYPRLTCEYTFSGGRFFSSRWGFKSGRPVPPRSGLQDWTAIRWEGTLVTLTECNYANCENTSWALADNDDIRWR